MKFCCLVTEYTGCFYWRIRVPFFALAERGHDVRMTDSKCIVSSDEILVIQRNGNPTVPPSMVTHLKNGGKVLFEIDDDIHSIPQGNSTERWYSPGSYGRKIIEEQMRMASVLVVSTPRLAQRYSEFNPNVAVCYNAADLQDIRPYLNDGEPEDSEEIRFGWGGSSTHEPDFATVVEPISRVLRQRKNARFVFVGADMRHMFPRDVRPQMRHAGGTDGGSIPDPPSLRFLKLLADQRLHFAIAPIASLVFNASKSWVKCIEFGALGIPLICSRFGPYIEYHKTAPVYPVILAETRREWEDAMLRLIDNPGERERLRRRNRMNVLAQHLSSHRAVEWERACESMYKAPVAV